MAAVLVLGAGTDVGKTYAAAALIRALKGAGQAVDALKPLVSGFDAAAPAGSDPAVLLAALGRPLTPASLEAMSPWRYRAPLAPNQAARAEGRMVDAQAVVALCRARMAASGDGLLVIESAGGVMSPLDDETTMLDLAVALAIPVILVAGSYLGTISHTLTAAKVIAHAGPPLMGVICSESLAAPSFDDTCHELSTRLAPVPAHGLGRGDDGAALLAFWRRTWPARGI